MILVKDLHVIHVVGVRAQILVGNHVEVHAQVHAQGLHVKLHHVRTNVRGLCGLIVNPQNGILHVIGKHAMDLSQHAWNASI